MFVTWTAWSSYRSHRTGGPPTEPNVNLSHSVADILQNHVTFQPVGDLSQRSSKKHLIVPRCVPGPCGQKSCRPTYFPC